MEGGTATWVALGRMSHCEEVVLVLTLATSRRASVKSMLKGEQQMKLRNKKTKKERKRGIISPHLIQNFFSTISRTFALPPIQLHGSSHNFIQLVAARFNTKHYIAIYVHIYVYLYIYILMLRFFLFVF